MTAMDRIRALVEPLVAERGLRIYDLERQGPVLRLTVQGGDTLGVDDLGGLTRAVSRRLDEADPIDGRYTLEVSSPGLERTLRSPEHFAGAVGEIVTVKRRRGAADEARRLRGVLIAADDDGIELRLDSVDGVAVPADELASRRVGYDEVDTARTVFEWGPAPKPGGASGQRGSDQLGTRRQGR
ncbi:MAG TPA: ribosome maturation factor RimP [Acidimicrobiales bacterium]|nr:ribosome maturation factor RimP [Acidimicrobiales bacterium]